MKPETSILKKILRSKQTVFSFKELVLLSGYTDLKNFREQVSYYVKRGDLNHIRRGLYAKDENYDRNELATKILIPSYIGFETVLRRSGIIFQYYGQIFVASYASRTTTVDGQEYVYRALKRPLLTNAAGIINKGLYAIATPERAFLDMLYIHKDYHFDNEASLDWEKVYTILPIYKNKRMERIVAEHFTISQEVERTIYGS